MDHRRVAAWIVLTVLKHVAHRKLLALSRKTESRLDDLVALLIHKIKGGFIMALSAYAGSLVLSLPSKVNVLFGKLVFLAVLLQAQDDREGIDAGLQVAAASSSLRATPSSLISPIRR